VRARPAPISPSSVERGEEAELRPGRGAKESTIKPRDEAADERLVARGDSCVVCRSVRPCRPRSARRGSRRGGPRTRVNAVGGEEPGHVVPGPEVDLVGRLALEGGVGEPNRQRAGGQCAKVP
jgi:hypothetical protein